jgi:hypothetical protein
MAGILKTADIRGFLENLDEFYNASDAEGAVWTGFISAWAERFGEMEITSSDLFTVADSLDLGTGSERSQKTKLGKILSRARDRRHGDYQIVQAALRNGLQLWKLNNVLHEQAAEQ